METENRIYTAACDSCGHAHPGVLFHHLGTPVFLECKNCNPAAFEAQSRQEIDVWLQGGEINLGKQA
jgi:hypothetical protein